MADKSEVEIDDATRLVLEVVAKVLDSDEEDSALLYPSWSANDGSSEPRGGASHGGEVKFRGTDLWSRYGADTKAKESQGLNMRFAKNATSFPQARKKYCTFCKRNGESAEFCSTHLLFENGVTSCPVLKECVCKICKQKGHTLSHCPLNPTKLSIAKLIHRHNNKM